MNIDDLDDDEPGFEEYRDPEQTDSFFNPENIDSRAASYQEEEEETPEDDWIYKDLFAGTSKVKYKDNKPDIDDPRWDQYKL